MNGKRNMRRALAAALTLLLVLTLVACGAKDGDTQTAVPPAPAQASKAEETQAPAASPTAETPPAPADGYIHVHTVEEFAEAIRPQAKIMIEPGRYNLTDFLSGFPNVRDWDAWNEEHDYVQIRDAFDGLELEVMDVTNLCIEGNSDNPADTELVIEPRHATVLSFSGCTGVELACLTVGHTDGADCSGNVLDFYNCRNIRLRTMNLYGCGAYGISAMGGTGDLEVSNSTIRDCSYGPFEIYSGSGPFTFTACTLVGSDGGGDFESNGETSLSFIACSFGQEESNLWRWDERATFEDCEFMAPDYFPDIEPDYEGFYGDYDEYVPVFDPEAMEEISFREFPIENTWWNGYAVVDPQSGDTRYLSGATADDYAVLNITLEGEASLTYRGATEDFTWYFLDSDSVCLENAEHNLYISLYKNADSDAWLLMQYDNELIWFY